MRNTLKVLKDVETRKSLVAKAIRDGNVSVKDFMSLQEQYAFVYKDHSGNSALGMGRSGSANLSGSTNDYIQFIITTLEEDRDGDIVVPMGRVGKNYANNPVWFFGHQEWEIPIGTSRAPDGSIAVTSQRDKCISNFYPDRADPDAMFVFGKVQRGILNATSIAFVPLIAQRREEMYKSNPRDTRPSGWRFDSWDHTETSIVGVPANAGAIRDSLDKEKSFITPRLQKALKPYAAKSRKEQGIVWSGWCPNGDCAVKKQVEKAISVQAYRDLTSELSDAFASVRSAATDEEKSREKERMHKVARELMNADCPKASEYDKQKAQRLLDQTATYKSLSKKDCGCKSKDKSLAESSGTSGGYTVPPCECGGKPDCPCGNKKSVAKSEYTEMSDAKLKKEAERVRAELDRERDAAWAKHGSHVGAGDLIRLEGPQSNLAKLSSKYNLLVHEAKTNRGLTLKELAVKKKTPVKQPVAKSKSVRKADMDEEDQVMKDDAHDLISEDIEMEDPFTVKPSAASIVKTYQHAKAEAEFLEDEISKLDHPGIEEGLTKYKAKFVDPRMEHLKGMLHTHHAKGEGDPDEFLDKCMKGMETDGTGGSETDPGEEGMVQAGEIPPEDEVVSKRRKSVRKSGEKFRLTKDPKAPLVEVFDASGEIIDSARASNVTELLHWLRQNYPGIQEKKSLEDDNISEEVEDKDLDLVEWAEQEEAEPEHEEVIDEEVGINPDEDTEEILERYQHPKNLKWYTRKVGTAKRVGNKLVLVKEAEFLEEEEVKALEEDNISEEVMDKDATEEIVEEKAEDDLSPEDMERLKQLTNRLKDYGFAI